MHALETDIDRLAELDQWRIQAAKMRNLGKSALRDLPPQAWGDPTSTRSAPRNQVRGHKNEAGPSGSRVAEDAMVVQALLRHRRRDHSTDTVLEELVKNLEKLPVTVAFDPEDDGLPVLRAARVMSALVAAPNSAFSRSVLLCYYMIIRELYSADAPDWLVGGARAGEGLSPCAAVTNECVHAVLGFAKALEHTSEYIGRCALMLDRRQTSTGQPIRPREWSVIDDKRATIEFLTTTEIQKENIALKLSSIPDSGIDRFAETVSGDVESQIAASLRAFLEASEEIRRFRNRERHRVKRLTGEARATAAERLLRSDTPHQTATKAVDIIVAELARAQGASKENSPTEALRLTANVFSRLAEAARAVVQPATEYVSRVVDRELAAASIGATTWDAGEMLFGALSYGYLTGRWDDNRLRRVGAHVSQIVSERGRFPLGRPLHVSPRGYNLHLLNIDIIRAFAQLARRAQSIPLDADVVKKMMYFAQDTQVADGFRKGASYADDKLTSSEPRRGTTASAVLALDHLNRMLDERINVDVLKNFSVREPRDIEAPTLPDLFYSDYGLASTQCPGDIRREESVAVVLERMRAHVAGVHLHNSERDPLFSLILHGPPGTGKTTLVEALAKSCNTPLVEVTPSDVMTAGVDNVESRARAVFKALSLLTRVVVIFDEFDPVLVQRKDGAAEPTAFSFLTPGMLPKLKTLYVSAARRSVAYVLVTNLIGKMDKAAIREGRFDVKMGIYPPDLLSRTGRLSVEINDFCRKNGVELRGDFAKRFQQVIVKMSKSPMNTIGRPGWFTAPRTLRAGSPFGYLFGHSDTFRVPNPEAELQLPAELDALALRELREFAFVDVWDRVALAQLSDADTTEGDSNSHGATLTASATLEEVLSAEITPSSLDKRIEELS